MVIRQVFLKIFQKIRFPPPNVTLGGGEGHPPARFAPPRNVVIPKGREETVFLNARHFFSRSRMDMRVGAFESPMSQLSQRVLFVFIELLKKILHHLKVGGNPFWGI